jgi:hypothetical protein
MAIRQLATDKMVANKEDEPKRCHELSSWAAHLRR